MYVWNLATRHPRGFLKSQDGRQDGQNSKPKCIYDNNANAECSKIAMLLLYSIVVVAVVVEALVVVVVVVVVRSV